MSEPKKERRAPRSAEEIAADHEKAAATARRRGAMKALMETPAGREAWIARRELVGAIQALQYNSNDNELLALLVSARDSVELVLQRLNAGALLDGDAAQ